MHFHEEDILNTFTHVINGKKVEIARGKWSLVEGCVPKIFPNLPAYLLKPATKKRKLPDRSGTLSRISSAKKDRLSASTAPEESEVSSDVPSKSGVISLQDRKRLFARCMLEESC